MDTSLNQGLPLNYTGTLTRTSSQQASVFTRFINWCENQQPNRLLWLGLAVAGHGCILTPLTIMIVLVAGNSFALFMTAIVAMAMVLVTNLAAMPTKVTVPVFILSILIDLGIIAAAGIGLA